MDGCEMHQAIKSARGLADRVYLIVDSARDRKLARDAWGVYDLKNWWLFDGSADPQMAPVAPYLIDLGFASEYPYPASDYLQMFAERLGTSAGILLLTPAEPRTLWEHLRTLFFVMDESGSQFFFRFYDPRVLRVFLPTCTKEQIRQFFGPVSAFLVEDESGHDLCLYTESDSILSTQKINLSRD